MPEAHNHEEEFAKQFFDLRRSGRLPPGETVYVQSGDPGDFDGYIISIAGTQMQRHTSELRFALVVPERRACSNRDEPDVNKHDEQYSEEVMHVTGRILRFLCPGAFIVRGPLNDRNVIPLSFVFSEPEGYGPMASNLPSGEIYWRSVRDLAALVNQDTVKSVILDMNGSIAYLRLLMKLCPKLGIKVKASGVPITIMAGVLAEVATTTFRVPGRDPRSTMNALYSSTATGLLLDLAAQNQIPLMFITNNLCNKIFRFEDAADVGKALGLKGVLMEMASAWYGPHLNGKCVPFDWVALCALLFNIQHEGLLKYESKQLFVGKSDKSIMVLRDPDQPVSEVVRENLRDTEYWGEARSVADIDNDVMLRLVRYVSQSSPEPKR